MLEIMPSPPPPIHTISDPVLDQEEQQQLAQKRKLEEPKQVPRG